MDVTCLYFFAWVVATMWVNTHRSKKHCSRERSINIHCNHIMSTLKWDVQVKSQSMWREWGSLTNPPFKSRAGLKLVMLFCLTKPSRRSGYMEMEKAYIDSSAVKVASSSGHSRFFNVACRKVWCATTRDTECNQLHMMKYYRGCTVTASARHHSFAHMIKQTVKV